MRDRFYLVPYDLGYEGDMPPRCAQGMLDMITRQSISDLELAAAFEGLQAGHQAFVIDACNSGQALEAEEKRRGPMNSKGLAQLAYEKGMYILTAAQSYQVAKGAGKLGHGYLTYALVEEGLKQGLRTTETKAGAVTLREWFDYATQRVPQMQQAAGEQRLLVQTKTGSDGPASAVQSEVQHPRVFYRRELEAQPLIVAQSVSAQPRP